MRSGADEAKAPDRLSLFAAAREAPAAPGLRIGARDYSYAELAALTEARLVELRSEGRGSAPRSAASDNPNGGTVGSSTTKPTASSAAPYPVVGTNTLETAVTLYALLEARVPALLIHPKLTETERADLKAIADRAGPPHADAAAILFTSGTTGKPRGAVLTRDALLASAAASAANLGWEEGDCWLLCMPIARVGGLSILTRCLAARRCVALAPAFDAQAFPAWIDEQRITLASVVPTMLTRILDLHPDWRAPAHLRAVQVGGDTASSKLLARAERHALPIVITYGLTESCSQVCLTPYAERHQPAVCGAGKPLPGVELRISDIGHIELRGPMLMAGYWDGPPLDRDEWFDTGDLGTLDSDGCLHVHARRADLIVTGGENAYPAEIERALEAIPGIAAAGVFGIADETWGQRVAAALVADDTPPSDAALYAYVRGQLAPHKRPRFIAYIDRLPQTAGGKLDRGALAGAAGALRPLVAGAN